MDPARLPDGIPDTVLLELFVRSGTGTMERFRTAIQRWADTGSEAGLADARRLAHNLKGSSFQLGFEELGHLAEALELYTVDLMGPKGPPDPPPLELLDAAAELALCALKQIAAASSIPNLTEMTARLAARIR